MLQRVLLSAAHSSRLRSAIETVPATRSIVDRYVAGPSTADALAVARRLRDDGLLVTLDHLGEDVRDRLSAAVARDAYLALLERLAVERLTDAVEVSVKISALGHHLPHDGPEVAQRAVARICAAARDAGTTVTLDMEDHTTTDATLALAEALRPDFPWIGVVVQAYLRRSEDDCRALAGIPGARVRLCKGAYDEPGTVAFRSRAEVDRSYVRCLRLLMAGKGNPLVATHDPRLIDIAVALAARNERTADSWEFQMLHGVRPDEQRRIAAAGHRMRVYVPYGGEWYGYLMRRLAERPANMAFFLRSLAGRR